LKIIFRAKPSQNLGAARISQAKPAREQIQLSAKKAARGKIIIVDRRD
jgi:hypothetical protein